MPDLAIMTLGVVREAPTTREALDVNNKAMAEVIRRYEEHRGGPTVTFRLPECRYTPALRLLKKRQGTQKTKLVAYLVSNAVDRASA